MKDAFRPGRRALEEHYFHKREQELIEKLRRRAEEDSGRQRLAERTGVADQEILQDLQAIGFSPETVTLLHLAPLLHVAWADGSMADQERRLILTAARARGIEEESPAGRLLRDWLIHKPADAVFDRMLRAITAMLDVHPEESEHHQRDLLSYCTAIAAASGGILGFGVVCEEERRVLALITAEFERRRSSATEGP